MRIYQIIQLLHRDQQFHFKENLSTVALRRRKFNEHIDEFFCTKSQKMMVIGLEVLQQLCNDVIVKHRKFVFFEYSEELLKHIEDCHQWAERQLRTFKNKQSDNTNDETVSVQKTWNFVKSTVDELEERTDEIHQKFFHYFCDRGNLRR